MFKLGDTDFAPAFAWMGAGLMISFLSVPALFLLYPFVGPIGMLVCLAIGMVCVFRGFFIGLRLI